jgi:hypothetical protein
MCDTSCADVFRVMLAGARGYGKRWVEEEDCTSEMSKGVH